MKIPRKWHLALFMARLLSIAPALIWGLGSGVALVEGILRRILAWDGYEIRRGSGIGGVGIVGRDGGEWEVLGETVVELASIWVCRIWLLDGNLLEHRG